MRKACLAGMMAVILLCVLAVAGSVNKVSAAEHKAISGTEKSLYVRLGG